MRVAAFLLGLLCAAPSWALDVEALWVRKISDCQAQPGNTCGTEDGTSFENAFRGYADVLVSATDGTAGRLDPGDILISCAPEGEYFGDADKKSSTAMFTPNGTNISGNATDYTVLTGSCPQDGYSRKAWLNGEGLVGRGLDSSTAAHAYWHIYSFEISGVTGTGIYSQGVYTDVQPWLVDDVWVHDLTPANSRGIRIQGIGSTLQNSIVDGTGDDNVYWEGANARIINNVLRNPSTAGVSGDNIQFDKSAANFLISGNELRTSVDAKQCVFISTTLTGDASGRAQDNECYGPSDDATLHTAFMVEDAGGNRVYWLRNYAERSRYHTFCGGNTKCTMIGNVGRSLNEGLACGTGTSDCEIQHNAIFDAAICINTSAATGTSIIQNNTLRGCTTSGIRKNAGDTESYNAVFESSDFVQNESVTTSAGTGAVTADPGWVNDDPSDPDGFCLEPDSPLLGAGTYLGAWATGYANADLGKPPAIGPRGTCYGRATVTSRPAVTSRPLN